MNCNSNATLTSLLLNTSLLPGCMQGVVGSMPWNGLVFLTLYLQLLGESAASA